MNHKTKTPTLQLSQSRQFGLLLSGVFLILAIAPLFSENSLNWLFLGAAALLTALSFLFPLAFLYPTKAWLGLGVCLHKIVSPVVLALVYYLAISPMALLLRLSGKRLLDLKWDKNKKSYWKDKEPKGPPPETMVQQF